MGSGKSRKNHPVWENIGGVIVIETGKNDYIPAFMPCDGIHLAAGMDDIETNCIWLYNNGRGMVPKSYFKR